MSPSGLLADAIAAASRGHARDAVRRFASSAHAASLFAERESIDDSAWAAAMEARLTCIVGLAEAPSASAAHVALKLASLVRLRLADSPDHFGPMERLEFLLLTACLADTVLLAEAPIGSSPAPAACEVQGRAA